MAAYTYDFDVRMGVTKKSNRQVYQDFVKRRRLTKRLGFEDFPRETKRRLASTLRMGTSNAIILKRI